MKLVTVDEMREIERRSEAAGVSTATLMENAGRSVAVAAERRLAERHGQRVLVLVGPGNNGGDGLVAARHLHDAGASVALYLTAQQVAQPHHLEATAQRGIPAFRTDDDADLANLRRELGGADLIVDAILGTGRARPAAGLLKAILDTVNRERRADSLLLAVDLPTGLNADTGAVDPSCLRADFTVTLGFPKVGLFAFPGAAYVGDFEVGDIGLPPGIADDVRVELATREEIARLLPPRPPFAHKGTFGKVMVAGGSRSYVGAPVLACLGAGRVGAGLVTLACAGSLHPIFAAKLTEATFAPLADGDQGVLIEPASGPLLRQLEGYDVLLVGPGLGRAETTQGFVYGVLGGIRGAPAGGASVSCVVDADALNALATKVDWWTLLPPRVVLTPHSGEMARLLRTTVEDVNAGRLAKARAAAARWSAVVVLKGAFTVVAAPDGRASINPIATPALATAGTGDVLAGAIAGLLAQRLDPFAAAVAAVYLHARAGRLAADSLGDAGALAGDLPPLLPKVIRDTKLAP